MKKSKKGLIIFFSTFIFTLLVFLNFINMHYATDTYNIINRGYKEYAIKYSLNDGRPIMCLISLIADFFNVPINVYIISLTIMALFVSCISVLKLKSIVMKYKYPKSLCQEIILLIICYTTIFNFMYLENMYFAECLIMAISILLFIISVDILLQKRPYYILKSLLLVILGVLFYQGTIGVFVSIACIISIIKNKNNIKQILKDIIISAMFCGVALGINLIQIKIYGNIFNMTQTRMGDISQVFTNLKYVCFNLPIMLLNTADIFPKYTFFAYVILLFVSIWCYYLSKGTKELLKVLNIVLIIFISLGSSFVLNIFSLTSFGSARLMFSLGALIGYIFIYLYVNTDLLEKKALLSKMIKILLVSYFIIIVINYVYIMTEHEKIEILNSQECKKIDSYIREYENETGNIVKNIAVCYDSKVTYNYSSIRNQSSLCLRPLSAEWSDDGSINFYTGRDLKEVSMTNQLYISNFKGKNWDELSKEQFLFIGDTVYYCVY